MAKKSKKSAGSAGSEGPQVEVTIPVPQNTKIRVTDLKNLNAKEIADILETIEQSKVKFVILNAPFKVRSGEPVS